MVRQNTAFLAPARSTSPPVQNDDPVFRNSGRFPTTRWSLVSKAKDRLSPEHVEAVNALVSKYWKPVFYFIRAKRYALDRAEDLTQEFFLGFLERDWIRRVDRTRGRFRTFMLTILVRFLADQGPNRVRRQKRFEQEILSISALLTDRDRTFEPPTDENPESIFMQRWAMALVDHARVEVQRQLAEEDKSMRYALFEAAASADPLKARSQTALAREHRLTRDQVRYAVNDVRQRLDRQLRAELRRDGCPAEEIDDGVSELIHLLEGEIGRGGRDRSRRRPGG
jgi:DNA-directed RNA polymerase specialized sigma24 family protein